MGQGQATTEAESQLRSNSTTNPKSSIDLLRNYEIAQGTRQALRTFYSSEIELKNEKKLRIMEAKAYRKILADERKSILQAAGKKAKHAILCIGTQGTGVGSPIKGRAK
ncbi:uncharacterized protein BYT42DRAFT_614620 [Radiomyces spectabilis]|uniref:uncharacterized protein n=1 Tax=Radiomyces spectabilis TaxID=64574 RepID=UPI0022205E74|nr:uncharacterized protein BYT42DRAFT_614620 [Radiomyces spectabilis]KAI8377986.1 hypothetical protein BYT42DRAFT_614620 [Radiomyces spectabilis]